MCNSKEFLKTQIIPTPLFPKVALFAVRTSGWPLYLFCGCPRTFLCDSEKNHESFGLNALETTEIEQFWSSSPLQADHCQSNTIRDAHHQWNKLSLNLTAHAGLRQHQKSHPAQTGIFQTSAFKTQFPLRLGFPCCFQLQIKLHWLKDTLAMMTWRRWLQLCNSAAGRQYNQRKGAFLEMRSHLNILCRKKLKMDHQTSSNYMGGS